MTSPTFVGLPVIPPNDPSLLTTNPVPRKISFSFLARETREGAGATVRRSIGTPKLRNLSPFLMLDHAGVSPGAGFPDHPHRGQETITYVLHGTIDHEDFTGSKGTLTTGDLQFMTAGRGIVHAEMPRESEDGSPVVAMQLWVDLPKELKMCEPRYRDLRASEIPQVEVDGGRVKVKVISGRSHGVDSPKQLAYTPVWYLDVTVKPGGKITQNLPSGWNVFAYTLEGETAFGAGKDQQKVSKWNNVVFERNGDAVVAEVPANAQEDSRFALIAGSPLDQNIVQHGPFVLNSKDEVMQAMFDYQTSSNGFERARDWESTIGKALAY